MDTQCRITISLQPPASRHAMAPSISDRPHSPVLMATGFPFDAIYFKSGVFVTSIDATFMKGTSSSSASRSISSFENPVEIKSIPSPSQYCFKALCSSGPTLYLSTISSSV